MKLPSMPPSSADQHPGNVDDDAEAEIPDEGDGLAGLAALHRFGKLRIDEQEEGEELLDRREMADVAGDRRRIEHVAEIDGEDGQHDQPGLDIVAEEFETDHLAGAGIDGGAHEGDFGERHALFDGKRAEQGAERGRRQRNGEAGPQTFDKVGAIHRHLSFFKSHLLYLPSASAAIEFH